MHKAAAGAIGAGARAGKGAAHLGLVLGVALHRAQVLPAVSKLALGAVAARARLAPGAAQLSLRRRGVCNSPSAAAKQSNSFSYGKFTLWNNQGNKVL